MEKRVVFVDGVRTAFGRAGGSLRDFSATELAGFAIRGLLDKTGVEARAPVDCVFAGIAGMDTVSFNPARYAALAAGLPYETTASFVEMQCGSAIDCINHVAWKILCGGADIIIAGGMESCSQMPVKFSTAVQPYRGLAPMPFKPSLTPVPEDDITMIEVSDKMAVKWNVTRRDADEFALRSH